MSLMHVTSWRGSYFVDRIARTCPLGMSITTLHVDGGSEVRRHFADRCRHYGFTLVVTRPASPQHHAYGDRVHRTFVRDYYGTRMFPASTCAVINEGLKGFCHYYTHRRPHWGNELRTPMEEITRVAEARERTYTKSAQAP